MKAGRQHWYIVYYTRKDLWEKDKAAEEDIGYTIIKGTTLEELEPLFDKMQKAGVIPTEHIVHQTFWKLARKAVKELPEDIEKDNKPCECVF